MVIVSAGIGEVVEKSMDLLFDEIGINLHDKKYIHILANGSEIANNNEITGFKEPLVHTLNKDEILFEYLQNHHKTKESD